MAGTSSLLTGGAALSGPGPRLLILNGDDWGANRESTDRILDCHRARRLTSTSAMVYMADSSRAAGLSREHSVPVGLHLNLTHEQAASAGSVPAPGSPVVGAQVTVTTADGKKYIQRVDGGGGHGGKRSTDINIGLGGAQGPVQVHLQWRDRDGVVHSQDLQLSQGRHSLVLGDQAKER